jgi:hypothetical protein
LNAVPATADLFRSAMRRRDRRARACKDARAYDLWQRRDDPDVLQHRVHDRI